MWQVIGATVQGASHIRTDTPCQDAHDYRVLDQCVIAAIADGLGSCLRSDEGSVVAVKAALDFLEKGVPASFPTDERGFVDLMRQAFTQAIKIIENLSKTKGEILSDYGTTLSVVLIVDGWICVGQIGDGAVVVQFLDNTLKTISLPQRGEYINETIPLTSAGAITKAFFFAERVPVKALAMFTDGIHNLAINTLNSAPFPPFFTPFFDAVTRPISMFEASEQLASFLKSERVCSRTDDDKTLIIIGKLVTENE